MVWNPSTCLKDSEDKLPGRHMISTQVGCFILECLGLLKNMFYLVNFRINYHMLVPF